MTLRTHGGGRTDVGRVRQGNEDALFLDDGLGLYVVADGMGGHQAGDVASSTAVRTVERVVRDAKPLIDAVRSGETNAHELVGLLERCVARAAEEVHELGQATAERKGMGCTLTILLVAGHAGVLGHVGDSRLYLLRGGQLHQLSSDHTMANQMLRAGLITEEEAEEHPHAHVLTRCVGVQPSVTPDTLLFDVAPGDRFLLCSDGLSNYVEDPQWLGTQLAPGDPRELANHLVDWANEQGGADNVTALIVEAGANFPEQAPRLKTEIQQRLGALESVFLFEQLSLAQLAQVMQQCGLATFAPGEAIIAAGQACDRLYIVVSGQLSVCRANGSSAALMPGDHVGETMLLEPRPAGATLIAQEKSMVLLLGRQRFLELARRHPYLGVALLERLALRLSRDLDQHRGTWDHAHPPTAKSLF